LPPVTVWPKVRPQLTADQVAVMEDWYSAFLGEVLPGKFGWVSRFNHHYALRTARPGTRTLEIGPGNGSHLDFENLAEQDEYVGVELRESLSRQIDDRHRWISPTPPSTGSWPSTYWNTSRMSRAPWRRSTGS
jgi:hypothetical protein